MVADIPTNRRQSKNLGDLVYTLPTLIRTLKAENKLEHGSKSGLKKHININV